MRFEYNSHLEFEDRVNLVSQEIQDEYPLISEKDAMVAAALAMPIDDKVTGDEKFDRYFYLMHTITKDSDEFTHVFNDAFNLYQDGELQESNQDLMQEIMNYLIGDRDSFPEKANS